MRRRDFIAGFSASTPWPLVAGAQHKSVPVIGYLNVGFPQLQHPFVVAFHEGLKEAGFAVGENVAIEYRWAEERYDRLPELAADLVRRKVEVIVATGELPLRAAASATSTIPVVFTIGSDPVQSGLVGSLARPDGNITGFTAIATELVSKRFELVSELLPQARKIAVLVNSGGSSAVSGATIRQAQQAVGPKGIQLLILKADDGSSLEAAFASVAQEHADAIVVSADAFFFLRREQITALAARYVVPAIYELQGFVDAGGLISYGPMSLRFGVRLAFTPVKSLRGPSQRTCRSSNRQSSIRR